MGGSGICEQDGDIFSTITDQAKTAKYLNFFNFYKIVAKMCHVGMVQKKIDECHEKVAANNKRIASLNVLVNGGAIAEQSIPQILAQE